MKLRDRMAADPGLVFEAVAKETGVTCRAVVEALPEKMRQFADGGFFEDVMKDLTRWGDVTFIVHTDDGIFEFSGPIPEGKIARGHYNLGGRTGLHGHLRHERCTGIAFVEGRFMGRNSAVIVFFNPEGGIMFKVFVGRDGKGELKQEQLLAFRALAEAVTPEPAEHA
jgi:putative heme utilization carrier protein HutX